MISEKERLSTLYSYAILDTESESDFENIVQLASQICNTPVSLISLIDQDRQWFKANKGFAQPETARSVSFCAHAIQQQGVMMVKDALHDERFIHNPLVTGDPYIRFYAGAPMVTSDGYALGALCVIDQEARELSHQQLFALKTLSQQVVTQLELRVKVRQLDAILKAKDSILSIISHDVKGPIVNIKQVLELFTEENIPHADMRLLSIELLKSIDMADLLLSDLLNWFLSQAESKGASFAYINLSDVLKEVVEETHVHLVKKNNSAIANILPDLRMIGDKNMLKCVFRNLLSNANKFTQNGLIQISTQVHDQHVVVGVKDTGMGIDPERLKKLFLNKKNSSMASTAGTANEKGHGLGLLLTQEFITKHNGFIEIFSDAGLGTKVQVSLPLTVNTLG